MDIQIERVLDKLEEEIRGGKKALFGNLRAVDDTKCLEYIASIRNLLPSSITEARVILQDKDNIIGDAHDKARDILNKARAEADQLIAEDRIVDEARRRANAILDDAERRASELSASCYHGIMDMFDSAETDLRNALQNIDKGRQALYDMTSGSRRQVIKGQAKQDMRARS